MGDALKAYSVLEEHENTGGIIFAKHAVTARRIGANEYADGEFGAVSCKRAPWADKYAETRGVPASEMVWNGWRFECCGCGVRIGSDLEYRFDDEGDLRFEGWTPDRIIGDQDSQIFCQRSCKDQHDESERQRRYVQGRAIARFMRVILRRFPNARFVDDAGKYRSGQHAYASRGPNGNWGVRQVLVPFTLPDFVAMHGPISLDWHPGSSWPNDRKPRYTCAGGDKEAFEAYLRARRGAPTEAQP